MASTKAVAAPKRAMTHIQKTAPGPPTKMADATPARLPVPTRLESDTAKAWKEPIFLRWASASFGDVPSDGDGRLEVAAGALLLLKMGRPVMTLIMSRNIQNCTPRILYVKKRAQKTRAVMTM